MNKLFKILRKKNLLKINKKTDFSKTKLKITQSNSQINKSLSNKKTDFLLERHVQNLVEHNLELIFDLQFIKSEYSIKDEYDDEYRFDTVAFDNKNKSFVIIEYKNNKDKELTDQCIHYHGLMKSKLNNLISLYNEKKSFDLKLEDVNLEKSKIIIISSFFSKRQINSTINDDINFEYWMVKNYSYDFISFSLVDLRYFNSKLQASENLEYLLINLNESKSDSNDLNYIKNLIKKTKDQITLLLNNSTSKKKRISNDKSIQSKKKKAN